MTRLWKCRGLPSLNLLLFTLALIVGAIGIAWGQSVVQPSPMIVLARGRALEKSGDYSGAAEAFEEYLQRQPADQTVRCLLIVVDLHAGRHDEAIAQFKVLQSAPKKSASGNLL